MLKKIAISLGVVSCLGLALWFGLDREPARSPGTAIERTIDTASAARVDGGVHQGDSPAVEFAGDESFPSALASLDLSEGTAGLEGNVTHGDGGRAAGAEVTLYRTQLTPELESEEGVSLWQLFVGDGGQGFGRGGPPFLAGGIERRPVHQRYRDALKRVARVTADDAGHYAFRGLAAGSYLVSAQASGSLDTPSRRVSYLAETVESVDVGLAPGARVSGVVVDPSGRPVARASVVAEGELWRVERVQEAFLSLYDLFTYVLNPTHRDTTTNSSGEFSIEGLPPLEYRFTASAAPWADGSIRQVLRAHEHVEVPLTEAAVLMGAVVSNRGPVPGVTVSLAPTIEFNMGGGMERIIERMFAMPLEVQTGDDGVFRFERLGAGRYDLSATAPTYQDGSVRALEANPGEVTEVSLALEIGGVLEGVVRDPAGQPIAGVEVRPRAESRRGGFDIRVRGARGGRGEDTVRTDAQGRFRIDTLASGDYSLDLRHDEWLRQSVRAAANDPPLEITLEPGFVVQGTVVDESEAPIAGALVSLEQARGSSRRGTTGVDGTFRIAGIEEGSHTLVVRARDRLTLRDEIHTREGDLGIILLPPAVTMAGIVLDPNGVPLAGARVQATKRTVEDPGAANEAGGRRGRGQRGEPREFNGPEGRGGRGQFMNPGARRAQARASAWTGQDGGFVLRLPEPDGDWSVTASHPTLKSETLESVQVRGAPLEGLTLRLSIGASVTGRVLTLGGLPVARASLTLRTAGEVWAGPPSMTRSEDDGSFRVTGLDPGEYELRAQGAGFAPTRVPNIVLATNQSQSLDVLLEPERVIRGSVVSASGVPIAGARILGRSEVERPRPAQSDAAGFFELGGLGSGTLDLQVRSDGYQTWRQEGVSTAVGELRIVMQPSFSLSGVVLDAETREPVARANLSLRSAEGEIADDNGPRGLGRRDGGGRGRTNDEGAFTIDQLSAGTWTLTVEANGYLSAELEGLVLPGGAVEVLLDAGARVRGRVTDRSGDPIGGVQVRVLSSGETNSADAMETDSSATGAPGRRLRSNRPVGRSTTDDDGRFDITGIPTGIFRVVFEHTEFAPLQREGVLVAPGAASPELQEVMDRGSEVTGRARLARDSTGVLVLQGGEPSVVRYHDLQEGFEYRFAGLSPGSYTLQYRTSMRRGETLSEVQFAIDGQRTQRVDLPAP